MKALAHIVCMTCLLVLFFALPLAVWGDASALAALIGVDEPDLVSSATIIQAAPDGRYFILINRERHADTLADWVTFFEGEKAAPLIMEDVSAVAIEGDSAGIEMAESLQSRLAEHQMALRHEVGPLALSKVIDGRFDVVVLSEQAAEHYDAQSTFELPFVEVVQR